MDFLVEIETTLPTDMEPEELERLFAAERERAQELRAAGTMHRIWRVPGRLANVAIWKAADAGELHDALMSLPMSPFVDVKVRALAPHPLEQ
jgi:muconolactone D-isomerase